MYLTGNAEKTAELFFPLHLNMAHNSKMPEHILVNRIADTAVCESSTFCKSMKKRLFPHVWPYSMGQKVTRSSIYELALLSYHKHYF